MNMLIIACFYLTLSVDQLYSSGSYKSVLYAIKRSKVESQAEARDGRTIIKVLGRVGWGKNQKKCARPS